MTEQERESRGSGSIPLLDPESEDMDYLTFRDNFASYANSLSSRFNILVDDIPPQPDPIAVENYEAVGGMNAHQRKLHENVVARHEEYVAAEKKGAAGLIKAIEKN